MISSHDANIRIHAAFAVEVSHQPIWTKTLGNCEASVDARVIWRRGGESLYFRDPDDDLLELATQKLRAND